MRQLKIICIFRSCWGIFCTSPRISRSLCYVFSWEWLNSCLHHFRPEFRPDFWERCSFWIVPFRATRWLWLGRRDLSYKYWWILLRKVNRCWYCFWQRFLMLFWRWELSFIFAFLVWFLIIMNGKYELSYKSQPKSLLSYKWYQM